MMFRDRLRKFFALGPLAGAYLIAALLPFERIGSFSFAGTTVRPSQIVLLLTLLALARGVIYRKIGIDWRRPEYLLLAVFVGANALSLVNAENYSRSLQVLAFTVFTATLAVALPALLTDADRLMKTRAIVLAVAAAVGAFGLWQFAADMAGAPTWLTGLRPQYTKAILGFTRIQAASLEPLYFADFLLLPIGLAAAWLISGADRKVSPKLYLLLGLLGIDLLLTASRGGYAGALATLAVVVWCYRRRLAAIRRMIALALGGIAVIAAALWMLAAFNVTTPDSLAGTFIAHVSNLTGGAAYVERVETFDRALAAFKLHPWTGIGIGGFGPFSARFPAFKPDIGWAIVNNETLELLAEVGIVGFAAFLAFLASVFAVGVRRLSKALESADPVRVGALAALAGMLVQYQTFSTLYIVHVWFAVGLVLAAGRLSGRRSGS